MVEFETIKETEVKFGNNKFVEIARKKAIAEDGETEFISISRGFFTPEGDKRFSKGKNVSFPVEKAVIEDLVKGLKDVLK
jgi:hypothetical protein|tara:strand:- start:647 stop:886 length:240 start_codon:yes stop_codon:yes gene_type:complete